MKRKLFPNVVVGSAGFDVASLRQKAESDPKDFMRTIEGLIAEEKGGLRWNDIRDLNGLFRALADVQVPVTVDMGHGFKRAIEASAFPLLSGALTVAGINDAAEAVPTIGQELVTERDDPKKNSSYASILSFRPDKGAEGVNQTENDFPEIGAGEERYDIGSKSMGYRIAIRMATVLENDTAAIVTKVDALAEIMTEEVEELTIRRVCDVDGSGSSPAEPYVLRKDKTATTLYTTTANSPGTRAPNGTRINNNALDDDTALELARVKLASMLNSRGKRALIPMSQCVLLVPDAVVSRASSITRSELVPGELNRVNEWGPRGSYMPKVLSTPKLDDFHTGAWYLGRFKKQFIRKWQYRMDYMTLTGDTQALLRSMIVFEARIAASCEVGAVEYNQVIQCLPGSTPPS